jgi:hypothetical protein
MAALRKQTLVLVEKLTDSNMGEFTVRPEIDENASAYKKTGARNAS